MNQSSILNSIFHNNIKRNKLRKKLKLFETQAILIVDQRQENLKLKELVRHTYPF